MPLKYMSRVVVIHTCSLILVVCQRSELRKYNSGSRSYFLTLFQFLLVIVLCILEIKLAPDSFSLFTFYSKYSYPSENK